MQPPLPTADEILDAAAQLEALKQAMRLRSASGKPAQGRYKKVDTARLSYINTVAFPNLRLGKMVPPDDWAMLFGPKDDDLTGAAKAAAHRWAALHHKDPRAAEQLPELDNERQLTLLEWIVRNPTVLHRPARAPRGAPLAYRVDMGIFKGKNCTVLDLVRDGREGQLFAGQSIPGGVYLHWRRRLLLFL